MYMLFDELFVCYFQILLFKIRFFFNLVDRCVTGQFDPPLLLPSQNTRNGGVLGTVLCKLKIKKITRRSILSHPERSLR